MRGRRTISVLRGYVDYLSGYLVIKPKVIHPLYLQCHTENLIQEKLHELHCEDALEQDIASVNNVILLAGANTIDRIETLTATTFWH